MLTWLERLCGPQQEASESKKTRNQNNVERVGDLEVDVAKEPNHNGKPNRHNDVPHSFNSLFNEMPYRNERSNDQPKQCDKGSNKDLVQENKRGFQDMLD